MYGTEKRISTTLDTESKSAIMLLLMVKYLLHAQANYGETIHFRMFLYTTGRASYAFSLKEPLAGVASKTKLG